MPVSSLELIESFLAEKRFAFAGASRNPRDFNSMLFREFRKRGYNAVPVNPQATEIEGQPCYKHIQEISPPVRAALVMTPAQTTEQVVRDCAEAGISLVWMYGTAGGSLGAASQTAVEFCEAHSIKVISGHCPFMFFPGTGYIHRIHGVLLKIFGRYPARQGTGQKQ